MADCELVLLIYAVLLNMKADQHAIDFSFILCQVPPNFLHVLEYK